MSSIKNELTHPSSVKKRIKSSEAGKPSAHTHLQIPEMEIDKRIINPSIWEDPVVLPSKRVLDAIGQRQYLRERRGVSDELAKAKFRINKIFNRLPLLDKDDYRGVLKSLYEATGEVPPRYIMIHLGLDFLPLTVPPDEVRKLKIQLSSSDKRKSSMTPSEVLNQQYTVAEPALGGCGAFGSLTDCLILTVHLLAPGLHQCFQEIWRLRYQRRYDVLQRLDDVEERGDFQADLLTDVSYWLAQQNEIMCNSLEMAYTNSETQKLEDAFGIQMRLCVKNLTTAFQKTREVSDELLQKFRLLYRGRPSPDDVKIFNNISAIVLLKNKNKWDWASRKILDLLTLAAKHTRNRNVHTALANGIALYTNMMKAAKENIDTFASEEKVIRRLNKTLEMRIREVAAERQLLHETQKRKEELNSQFKQLKEANEDARRKSEQLSKKIRLLGESLTKAKQQAVKRLRKLAVEKMQQEEASTKTQEELTKEDDVKELKQKAELNQELKETSMRTDPAQLAAEPQLHYAALMQEESGQLQQETVEELQREDSVQLQQMETIRPWSPPRVLSSTPTFFSTEATPSDVETRESITLQSSVYDFKRVLDNLKENVSNVEENIKALEVSIFLLETKGAMKREGLTGTLESALYVSQISGVDPERLSKTAISQLALPSNVSREHVIWMETIRSDCIATLKALTHFANVMSSKLNGFGARVLARRLQTAKTKIIRLELHRQTVIRNISAGVDEFFSEVKAILREFFSKTQLQEAEMKSQHVREESCRMMMTNLMRYKSKIHDLEEQYRTLFFMYMRLCEVARELKKRFSSEDFRQSEEMATDVNQKMEKWLSLQQGQMEKDLWIAGRQVKTNHQLLTKFYLQKKISLKCLQAGHDAFQEIFDIFDEKMACLVKLCYLTSQLPQINELVAKMKMFSKDISRQSHFEKYRQARYNRVMDKINAVKSRMQDLQNTKQEQMYNVWVLINQILLETGILLIFPRPKGMSNMEKYDKALKTVTKKPYVPLVNPENIQEILDKGNLPYARSMAAAVADNLHLSTVSLDTRTVTAKAFIPRGFAYRPMNEDNAEFLSLRQSAKTSPAQKLNEEVDAETSDREQDVHITFTTPSKVSMYDISHGLTDMEGEETETKEM